MTCLVEARDGPVRAKGYSALLQPFIVERRGEYRTRHVSDALSTLTANDTTKALLTPYYGGSDTAKPTDQPVGTFTTHEKYGLVHRHNTGGAEMTTPISEALRTLTSWGHQSIITADDITDAQVDECYFRMLEPREIGLGMAFDLMACVVEALGGAA